MIAAARCIVSISARRRAHRKVGLFTFKQRLSNLRIIMDGLESQLVEPLFRKSSGVYFSQQNI